MKNSTKKVATMTPDNIKPVTMTPDNLKPSIEKLESALESSKLLGKTMIKAWSFLNPKKSSVYGLVGGTGGRYVEVAAFAAILINAGACTMTRQGRLEANDKPFYKELVNALYYNGKRGSKTIFRGEHTARFDSTGLTKAGILHFNNRFNDAGKGWNTDFKLTRLFRDLIAGKKDKVSINFNGTEHVFKKLNEITIMAKV